MSEEKNKKNIVTLAQSDAVVYTLLAIHFLLNFLGSPALLYLYLVEMIYVAASCLFRPLQKSIIPILFLYFIEGQGKVLLSYNVVSRIFFDFCLLLAVFRCFLENKSFTNMDKLPMFFKAMIGLHFLWYGVQFFNINNVGFIGVLSATKIYIFPIIFFLILLNNPIRSENDQSNRVQVFILTMIILQSALAIYQMNLKEDLMLSIHPYYDKQMGGRFIGLTYRPFGTSHLAGAVSIYLYLTVGLIFSAPLKRFWKKLLVVMALGLSWFTMFITGVRSAMAKHIMIVGAISFLLFSFSNSRIKNIIYGVALLIISGVTIFILPMTGIDTSDLNIDRAISRFSIFSDVESIKQGRPSFKKISGNFIKNLKENPLGLGPGRTGAASGISKDVIQNDPVYGVDSSWSWENLFVALGIDFGIGMIFYTSLIVGLPILCLYYAFQAMKLKENNYAVRNLIVSGTVCSFIIIGNWAALGLPYPPESFIFWFLLSLGLNEYYEISRNKLN